MFAGFAAVQTGPRKHLTPTHLLSAFRVQASQPARHPVLRVLQLSIPVAVVLAVFPALTGRAWQVLSEGGMPAAMLVAVTACALAGIALRAAPAPGEPNVHDRQLDVILAVFFIGGSVWLTASWPEHFRIDQPLTGHQILAATGLLTGGYLLIAGTRLTARLRFVLILPLIAMPSITGRPAVLGLLVAVAIVGTLLLAIVRFRRSTRLAAATIPEKTNVSIENGMLPLVPVEHHTSSIDTAPRFQERSLVRVTDPRTSDSAAQIHSGRTLITDTGGW